MKELYMLVGAYYEQMCWWLDETLDHLVQLLSTEHKPD